MTTDRRTRDSLDAKVEEPLQTLYELRDDLQLIAKSDVRYAKYAQNALESLREAGYDISSEGDDD